MKNTIGLLDLPSSSRATILSEANAWMQTQTAEARIAWALEHLPGTHILSSSFGVQSAVMLHLMTRAKPDIPVLLMDTGYLFAETYKFIDELTQRLNLNLHVYRAEKTPAWQEALFGQLWEQGENGLKKYNAINKVEPMQRALRQHRVQSWFSGVRRVQSKSRARRQPLEQHDGRIKIHPIVDWTNRDVHAYLKAHDLPYHPLWDKGYVSVGDTHTTRRLEPGMSEEDTRFFGLMRECGLNLETSQDQSSERRNP